MSYQACLHSKTDVTGGNWTTLASGHTRAACLHQLSAFMSRQPLHHLGIHGGSLIRLYSQEQARFIETIQPKGIA